MDIKLRYFSFTSPLYMASVVARHLHFKIVRPFVGQLWWILYLTVSTISTLAYDFLAYYSCYTAYELFTFHTSVHGTDGWTESIV